MYKLFVLESYEKCPRKMAFDITNIVLYLWPLATYQRCDVLRDSILSLDVLKYIEIVLALCTLIMNSCA